VLGSVSLVDDDLLARLAAFLADHHGLIAGLAFPDDGGASLVTRALADGHAGADRPDAHATRVSCALAAPAASVKPAATKIKAFLIVAFLTGCPTS
jgi:hypothetical protein